MGAANRDPARYPDPDTLDITRRQGSHLSFGHGPHICIGAGLSLMVTDIVLRHLQLRWPTLRLGNQEVRWNGNAALRGLSEISVCWR